jgi:general L-amino acid transport system permease protein
MDPVRVPSFYRDERFLHGAAQVLSAVAVLGLIAWLVLNFIQAADARGLSLGFSFLDSPAGFPISDAAIAYDDTMPFSRAFLVGLVSTLRVSVIGIVFATVLGVAVALAYLSPNWLMSRLALAFIEFHRNIPLLVLLFIWYFTVFRKLPLVEEAIRLPGPIYLTQRGIYFTWPRFTETAELFAFSIPVAILLSALFYSALRRRRDKTGRGEWLLPGTLGILIVVPILGWLLSGPGQVVWDVPELQRFNFQGGLRLSAEFAGLLVGLTLYTAAFIAEVVRAGIQAVSRGQFEAAGALGLNTGQTLSMVVMPQALRVIIPPLISQYLNLTKNSSLALAIGYQDLFAIGKITINQAGRAVPVFILIMATYLTLSLITSGILNWYNHRIQFVER